MTQQKAFYEIKRPARVMYMVLVQPDGGINKDEACCVHNDCADNRDKEDDEEVYQCGVCGGWYCFDHIGHNMACYECQTLPMAIQGEIIAFRERLNALR